MVLDFIVYPFHMVVQGTCQIEGFLANHAQKFSFVFMDRFHMTIEMLSLRKCASTLLTLVSFDCQNNKEY